MKIVPLLFIALIANTTQASDIFYERSGVSLSLVNSRNSDCDRDLLTKNGWLPSEQSAPGDSLGFYLHCSVHSLQEGKPIVNCVTQHKKKIVSYDPSSKSCSSLNLLLDKAIDKAAR